MDDSAGRSYLRKFLSKFRRFIFSRTKLIMYRYSMEKLGSSKTSEIPGFIYRQYVSSDYPALRQLLRAQANEESIFKPVLDYTEVKNRLEKGGSCFICENKGDIVGYTWFAPYERYLTEINAIVKLPDKELYAYNSYVMKQYRGNNIFRNLLITGGRILGEQGFTGGVCTAVNWNTISHNILTNLGFRTTGYFLTGYCFFIKYFVSTCRDVSFVADAVVLDISRKFLLGIFYPLGIQEYLKELTCNDKWKIRRTK